MDDWTKEPLEALPTKRELYYKRNALANKKALEFIAKHPEGVTAKMLNKAGLTCYGMGRLMKLGIIKGEQIREPERGNRAFHWLWKAVKAENLDPNEKETCTTRTKK